MNTYYLFKRVDKYDVKLVAELEGTKEQADQLLGLMNQMNKSVYTSFELDRDEEEETNISRALKAGNIRRIKLIKRKDYEKDDDLDPAGGTGLESHR